MIQEQIECHPLVSVPGAERSTQPQSYITLETSVSLHWCPLSVLHMRSSDKSPLKLWWSPTALVLVSSTVASFITRISADPAPQDLSPVGLHVHLTLLTTHKACGTVIYTVLEGEVVL
ncbi:hypothetical protein MHYP_G00294890 [Metynnis hypsauchen]